MKLLTPSKSTNLQPGHFVYEQRGCTRCNGVGTIGRTTVHSVFSPNEAVRELMGTDCPILDIIHKAKESGFKTSSSTL